MAYFEPFPQNVVFMRHPVLFSPKPEEPDGGKSGDGQTGDDDSVGPAGHQATPPAGRGLCQRQLTLGGPE